MLRQILVNRGTGPVDPPNFDGFLAAFDLAQSEFDGVDGGAIQQLPSFSADKEFGIFTPAKTLDTGGGVEDVAVKDDLAFEAAHFGGNNSTVVDTGLKFGDHTVSLSVVIGSPLDLIAHEPKTPDYVSVSHSAFFAPGEHGRIANVVTHFAAGIHDRVGEIVHKISH
jgi:hypothetical protein